MKSIAQSYARELIDLAAGLEQVRTAEVADRFAELLAERRQLRLLPEVIEALEAAPEAGSVEVRMTAATEIPEKTLNDLRKGLAAKLDAPVHVSAGTDPDLLGGAIIHYDDIRFDGSLKGRLNRLKQRLSQ